MSMASVVTIALVEPLVEKVLEGIQHPEKLPPQKPWTCDGKTKWKGKMPEAHPVHSSRSRRYWQYAAEIDTRIYLQTFYRAGIPCYHKHFPSLDDYDMVIE